MLFRSSHDNVLYYSAAPTATSRGDFEDATGAGFPSANGTSSIAIPEINVQLKSVIVSALTKSSMKPRMFAGLNLSIYPSTTEKIVSLVNLISILP